MYRSDNPASDADRYMEALDILMARRPKCDCCDRHIQKEEALHYKTRTLDIWVCPECVDEKMEYIEVD